MESTLKELNDFQPISLQEMDNVKLMDRRDTKFIFKIDILPAILKEAKKYYKVLEIDNNKIQNYSSLYFDTDYFKFYTDHHNGKMNRHKVRFREYTDSKLHFLEVKFKNNIGYTRKKRIEIPEEIFQRGTLSDDEMGFVEERLKYNPEHLSPKLSVKYSRITLVHYGLKERATIDLNLSYKNNSQKKEFNGMIILEVKQDKLSLQSDIIQIMRKYRINNVRISKYCLGINSLFPFVKYNRFKPKIMAVEKLCFIKN
ncbi:MAG: polyphosphate polymerase domain-containing protein [Bacteroidota bacterium]